MDTFSSIGVGSIEIAKCAIFSPNYAISCDTRAQFLRGRRAVNTQTKWCQKLPSYEINKLNLSSLPPVDLRPDH